MRCNTDFLKNIPHFFLANWGAAILCELYMKTGPNLRRSVIEQRYSQITNRAQFVDNWTVECQMRSCYQVFNESKRFRRPACNVRDSISFLASLTSRTKSTTFIHSNHNMKQQLHLPLHWWQGWRAAFATAMSLANCRSPALSHRPRTKAITPRLVEVYLCLTCLHSPDILSQSRIQ